MNLHPAKVFAASLGMIVVGFVVGSMVASAPAQAASRSKGGTTAAPRNATTSYHFNNIPVRSALQLLAEEGRFNLVVSDSVQGNISLRLNDVTWEQALAMVLRIKGLQQRVDGQTRSVMTAGG